MHNEIFKAFYLNNNVENIVVFLGLKVLVLIIHVCSPAVEERKSLL